MFMFDWSALMAPLQVTLDSLRTLYVIHILSTFGT
jgi:hypothetical protein